MINPPPKKKPTKKTPKTTTTKTNKQQTNKNKTQPNQTKLKKIKQKDKKKKNNNYKIKQQLYTGLNFNRQMQNKTYIILLFKILLIRIITTNILC